MDTNPFLLDPEGLDVGDADLAAEFDPVGPAPAPAAALPTLPGGLDEEEGDAMDEEDGDNATPPFGGLISSRALSALLFLGTAATAAVAVGSLFHAAVQVPVRDSLPIGVPGIAFLPAFASSLTLHSVELFILSDALASASFGTA